MENKKLNDSELEKVSGGQAVLPLLSSEGPAAGVENVRPGSIKEPDPKNGMSWVNLQPGEEGKITAKENGVFQSQYPICDVNPADPE